jgi:lipopolysaccharide cholinephosphotransferase
MYKFVVIAFNYREKRYFMSTKAPEHIIFSPEDLRKLQQVELDMLLEADRICEKYNIKYCLCGGTLLGAARHKGFIPWDDDIDIIMLRPEYEKFFEACKTELGKDFFLQDNRTDPYYRWGYAKLRRNGSEYIRAGQEHMHYRTGIFIDIFVLDNVSDNPVLRRIDSTTCFLIRKIMWSEAGKVCSNNPLLRLWYRCLSNISTRWLFSVLDSIKNRNNKKKTALVRNMLFPVPKRGGFGFYHDWFTNLTKLEFENHSLSAPVEYNAYLTVKYNDYMQMPPPEKRQGNAPVSAIRFPGGELRKL